VERFVRRWFGLVFPHDPVEARARTERILKAYQESASIRLLAGNPMLLTIMVLIARQQELPRERAKLYEFSAEVLCHHWDFERHLEGQGHIALDDKKELLQRLAFRMQSAGPGLAGNFIHEDHMMEEIQQYLEERFKKSPGEAKRLGREIVAELRQRNYVLCLYGPGLYGFVHRTFLEFFCAKEFVRRLEKTTEFPVERLRDEVFALHWRDPAWHEVLRLICGMIGESFATKVIEFLVADANPLWACALPKQPPHHLALAAQCLGEVRKLNEMVPVGRALLIATVHFFETADLSLEQASPAFLTTKLLPAVAELGKMWPGREWLLERFPQGMLTVSEHALGAWFKLVVHLLGDQERVHDLLRWHSVTPLLLMPFGLFMDVFNRGPAIRAAALQALAAGWPQHADTLPLVRDRATQDRDAAVRRAALQALAAGWPDGTIRIALSRDLDGLDPFLDLGNSVPEDHWQKAANKLRMSEPVLRERLDQFFAPWGRNPLKERRKTGRRPG
jgi:hypothetical protein